jgi:hypothetical protein
MGTIQKKPLPVKLFCGIICSDPLLIEKAVLLMEKRLGKTDLCSDLMDFDKTSYYAEEMGEGLKKRFVSFRNLIRMEQMPDIKIWTNGLEAKLSKRKGKRDINLDPGYMTLANVTLATTKPFQHRIYIGKGIYLENTLRFRNKQFMDWEWTFPDHRTEKYKSWFMEMRKIYKQQLDAAKKGGA